MADPHIQKSKHFLKSLDEDMIFLGSLMAQFNSLSSQILLVSSNIKRTWSTLDTIHKSWENKGKGEKIS
jgi:hypothetical protein